MAEWAQHLYERYGICDPIAPLESNEDLIRGYFDTQEQIGTTGRP